MFGRSVVARLMLPLVLMTAVVVGMVWLELRARYTIAEAQADVETQVNNTLALTELRSTSRALQRDALNLGTEPDQATLDEINARFKRRYRDFTAELLMLEKSAATANRPYFETQREVLRQLDAVRDAAGIDRARALMLFRTAVRPAERRASTIANALIKDNLARIDALHREVRRLEQQSDYRLFEVSILMSLAALGIALLVTFRTVLYPLRDIGNAMQQLAAGNAELTIPHADRPDAIGAMARSIEVFRKSARERDALVRSGAEAQAAIARQAELADKQRREAAAQQEQRSALDTQRKKLLHDLADLIGNSVSAVNDKLRASAGRLSRSADDVARHALDAGRKAALTTGAAEKVTSDLAAIFSTGDALAESVDTLRGQTQVAAEAIKTAATRSRVASAQVASLSDKADEVAAMAELIRSVAQQTALLALNATIEASRVGEAGKGFAVVAAEMGDLAKQTSAATTRVDAQVETIRSAAANASVALSAIEEAIGQIDRHAGLVAGAMTQQGSVSAGIREGMRLAMENLATVGHHMANLGDTAKNTGVVAAALEAEASRLGADADTVDSALRRVIDELRTA